MSVCFATKCWAGDFEKFLAGSFERKIEAIGYPFDNTVMVFNNGVPNEVTSRWKGSWVKSDPTISGEMGVHENNHYAAGELAAVWFCQEYDYLCYVQGDVITQGGDWITPGIAVLESDPNVLLVSPLSDVNTRGEYDSYCSDQAFICRVNDLNKPEVYSYHSIDPDYPSYGGLSFEHLVGNYMKATGKKRKILTNFYVLHPAY